MKDTTPGYLQQWLVKANEIALIVKGIVEGKIKSAKL
jgi:hypothetical protein